MDSDQTILDFKNWGVDAFKKFFENFYPTLCLFANKYTKDPESSRDIVQEAFVYFWMKKHEVNSLNAAKSYLYKYVKNRSLNYLRNQTNRNHHNFEYLDSELFYRDNLIEAETYRLIHDAINHLAPQSQKIIELSLDGLKNQEIADQLNISLNTVKTIKLRAFRSLREELKDNIFVLFMINILNYKQ